MMDSSGPADGSPDEALSNEEILAHHRLALARAEYAVREFRQEFIQNRLVRWALRWAVGFALIAAVVYFDRDWAWLWWAGAVFASIMPVLALIWLIVLKRETSQVRRALAAMEIALLEAADG